MNWKIFALLAFLEIPAFAQERNTRPGSGSSGTDTNGIKSFVNTNAVTVNQTNFYEGTQPAPVWFTQQTGRSGPEWYLPGVGEVLFVRTNDMPNRVLYHGGAGQDWGAQSIQVRSSARPDGTAMVNPNTDPRVTDSFVSDIANYVEWRRRETNIEFVAYDSDFTGHAYDSIRLNVRPGILPTTQIFGTTNLISTLQGSNTVRLDAKTISISNSVSVTPAQFVLGAVDSVLTLQYDPNNFWWGFTNSNPSDSVNFFSMGVRSGGFIGPGSSLTSLNASQLTSGTVGTARLGSGTANNATFLRGDGTWTGSGMWIKTILKGCIPNASVATGNNFAAPEGVASVGTTANSRTMFMPSGGYLSNYTFSIQTGISSTTNIISAIQTNTLAGTSWPTPVDSAVTLRIEGAFASPTTNNTANFINCPASGGIWTVRVTPSATLAAATYAWTVEWWHQSP